MFEGDVGGQVYIFRANNVRVLQLTHEQHLGMHQLHDGCFDLKTLRMRGG